MTFIHLYLKKGKVKHNYLHWRSVMRLFENNFTNFKGIEKEFILIDLDNHIIISSQSCFRITDLEPNTLKKLRDNFKIEEN